MKTKKYLYLNNTDKLRDSKKNRTHTERYIIRL